VGVALLASNMHLGPVSGLVLTRWLRQQSAPAASPGPPTPADWRAVYEMVADQALPDADYLAKVSACFKTAS
jgi:hypothetical protein